MSSKVVMGYLGTTIFNHNDLMKNNLTNNIKGQKKWHEV